MKIKKSSELIVTSSPNGSFHAISDTESIYKSQQVKRKRSFESSNRSLLLLPIESSSKESKKRSKKKSKVARATPNWIVSPIKGEYRLESDSSSSDDDSYLMQNTSAIYAMNGNESFNSNNEDEFREFTQESFEELMEEADRGSDTDSNESEDKFYKKMKKTLTKRFKVEPPKKKRKIFKKPDNVRLKPIFSKNRMVLLMNHPSSLTIYRYVSVEVISGSVSVYGHELNPQSPPLKVFSSNATGLIELKTESCDAFWKKKECFRTVNHELQKVTGDIQRARQIMQQSSNSTVVVVLEGCILTPQLQFLELYYPLVFNFNMTEKFHSRFKNVKHPKRTYCLPCSDDTIQFNAEAEDLACDVLSAIRSSQLRESEGPRILVYGPKNTGKSSLLRYLMNKALSLFPSVFFLDADPGQTEFTPPGVVSLTQVTKPVIGPPFTHQRKPFAMSFTGAISAESSPDMYTKSVAKMAHMFQNNLSSEALFVNTMGWVKGIGLECLKNVIISVKPTILIEIITEEGESMLDYRECLPEDEANIPFYQIHRPFPGRPRNDLGAEDERSLSLLSYFGKCQLPYEKPMYLNSFKPVCISWDNIPIYSFAKKVPMHRLVESINASFVALCRVHESLILECSDSKLPKTLDEEPDNDCIGFGIVRAIDESKKLLYIITPLSLEELKSVNAIIKGNIMLPSSVFREQPIVGVPLPFAADLKNVPCKKETEDQDKIDTAKVYRKSIVKRCSVKRQHK